jgi:archaeal type IV pilus assembly protein PilA
MKSFRTIKKNAKALSPVVASIILIAVTVAVSVVVAAWMGGMSLGLMGNAEQATITNLSFTQGVAGTTSGSITATVQNTGTADIKITAYFINGNTPAALGSTALPVTVVKAGTNTVTLVLQGAVGQLLVSGTSYTVKLTTAKGNQLVYTQTYP